MQRTAVVLQGLGGEGVAIAGQAVLVSWPSHSQEKVALGLSAHAGHRWLVPSLLPRSAPVRRCPTPTTGPIPFSWTLFVDMLHTL